jgi:hypothetical protein
MPQSPRKAFKPLRLRLSQIEDPEVRSALEMRFEEVQVQREISVEAARVSAIADRERQITTAQSEIAFIRLMQEAGKHLPQIAREPVWAAFRDNGDVVFECPFSEGDMRNAMKVNRAQLEQQASQIEDGDDQPYNGDGTETDE